MATIVLLGLTREKDPRTKTLVGAALCAVGAIWGLDLFGILRGSAFAGGQQFGWYAMELGFLAVLVGGYISVLDQTKQLAGGR